RSADTRYITARTNQARQLPAFTGIHVANRGPVTGNLSITFLPEGGAAAVPFVQSLGPGRTLASADALREWFGATDQGGAIVIASDQPLSVEASVRRRGNGPGFLRESLPPATTAPIPLLCYKHRQRP